MTLRRKVLLIVSVSLAGLILLLYLVSQTLLMSSYLKLEDEDGRRNVQRALNTLQSEISAINGAAADWSYWDENYQFTQDHNADFITSNITDATFVNLTLNLIVLLDNQENVLFNRTFDRINDQPIDTPSDLAPYIKAGGLLFATTKSHNTAGIILLNDRPMLIVSRAILTSDKRSSVGGTLIFGRFLDEEQVERIAKATQVQLAFQRVADPNLPADFQAVGSQLYQMSSIVVQPADSQTLNCYTMLNDINNQPALYLKVQLARDIYAQGQASISTFILGILVVGIVIMGVTLILIERLVLARLAHLGAEVESVGTSGNLSARVNVSGADELSHLGNDINKMLSAIEKARNDLRKNEERLQTFVAELEASHKELVNNDHQLQVTVGRLEHQKRQLQRVNEFVRSRLRQIEDSLQHNVPPEDILRAIKTLQAEFIMLDSESKN